MGANDQSLSAGLTLSQQSSSSSTTQTSEQNSAKTSSTSEQSETATQSTSSSMSDILQSSQNIPESALTESTPQTELTEEETKTLVVYFSCTNTTKTLAEYAADILGADIYEIVPAEPYTAADLAYYTNGRADREQNDPSVRPAISGGVDNMSEYDTIILGYPIWHGQAPRIISTFLESYDFSGKTIVPFCTSHSSGIGSSADDLHSLCSAEWKDGKRFDGGTSRNEIENWLSII
ncbi:MAG: flavodoxin [Oscillospiraceae bacterium]|nr:flavodoxin [Oscillospiraceae bacterium]